MSDNQLAKALLSRIRSHDALVGIIGLGYVGLPLAHAFVEKGFLVPLPGRSGAAQSVAFHLD